ncbi:VOC family protein [Sphingomonas tagetis]|nr:VOC family protein [Sphingomonas tagetis]
MLPPVELRPAFNITRASHVTITVSDLQRSREFYTEVAGLVVSDEDSGTCYLRGLAEACHHSLTLVQSPDAGKIRRMGFRVRDEAELELAHDWFGQRGLDPIWVEQPFQGRTLHVSDPDGAKLELCAHMEVRPRVFLDVMNHRGARAQRIDHFQTMTTDMQRICGFYNELGFRYSEYIAHDELLLAAFMYRKGTCLDLAIVPGHSPRLHHFAYTVSESHDIFTACDVAGLLGYPMAVERGPGRHGPGGMLFVYILDPDGHRVEFFNSHYQTIDLEIEPVRWDAASLSTNLRWGLPAPERWYFEASPFEGVPLAAPEQKPNPETLERYLARLHPADAG